MFLVPGRSPRIRSTGFRMQSAFDSLRPSHQHVASVSTNLPFHPSVTPHHTLQAMRWWATASACTGPRTRSSTAVRSCRTSRGPRSRTGRWDEDVHKRASSGSQHRGGRRPAANTHDDQRPSPRHTTYHCTCDTRPHVLLHGPAILLPFCCPRTCRCCTWLYYARALAFWGYVSMYGVSS